MSTRDYPDTSGTIIIDMWERTDPTGAVWQLAAYNPHAVRYFDEDSQAIDETNYDVLRGDIGDIGDAGYDYRIERNISSAAWVQYLRDADGAPCEWADVDAVETGSYYNSELFDRGVTQSGLWVRVGSDAWDVWQSCARAVSDYPLLDESAYSEREFDAWVEWCGNGLNYDTARQLREWGVDEDTADLLSDADVLRSESQWLDHYSGFTGEHSPDIALVVLASAVDGLAACYGLAPRGESWQRRADRWHNRRAYV